MKDCCSFFSAARRTNQEALPQLSGFSARRLGRRRGLRNSLRSDSPRPFSSVFLASSPPNKGGINQSFFRFYSTFFFLPLRPADTSPIFCYAKHPVILRDTAGRRLIPYDVSCLSFSPLYFLTATPRNATGHGRGRG